MRVKTMLLVLFLSMSVAIRPAGAQAAKAINQPGPPAQPLASFIASDGTLNLPPGFRGSLDARRWTLVSGEGEPPRFSPQKSEDRGAGEIESRRPHSPGDERWADNFTPNGVGDDVSALAVDGGGNVYVGGRFHAAGDISVNRIAEWNGSSWSSLGFGFSGVVRALAVDNSGALYAGGWFSYLCGDLTCNSATNIAMNHLAKWNGSSWVSIGNGVNDVVFALVVDSGGNLYAGGGFTGVCGNPACNSGNTPVNRIAKWNPSGGGNWSHLGNGLNNTVHALAIDSNNTVYIGGDFTNLCGDLTCVTPGNQVNHVARWLGTPGNWGDLTNGLNASVQALAVDGNNNVYAGGSFQFLCEDFYCTTRGTRVNYIAKWNPSGAGSWSAVGNGLRGGVLGLAVDPANNALYVGGSFTNVCGDLTCGTLGAQVNRVAKWNPAGSGDWSALDNGMPGGWVGALVFRAGNLYAAGGFGIAGETVASNIALYTRSSWSALASGDGLNAYGNQVHAAVADGQGDVYVGGLFNTAGKVVTSNIAKWNGGAWEALGNGVHGEVNALAIDSAGNVFAGGSLDYNCVDLMCISPGPNVNHIARWNGSSWSGLGYGLNGDVMALAFDRVGNLYAGGRFSNACANAGCSSLGLQVNYIAKWDGNHWFAIGNGLNSNVNALAVDTNNNVYVGGSFVNSCGDSACSTLGTLVNHVAKWNPAGSGAWSPLGYGVGGDTWADVYALAVDTRANVYVAGSFPFLCGDTACASNGAQVNYTAKWNPSGSGAWSALGNGLSGEAHALSLDPADNLFVGGWFTKICGEAACTGTGTPAGYIAKWNSAGLGGWSTLGSGTDGDVNALAFRAGALYVGGNFDQAGGKPSVMFGKYVSNRYLYLPLLRR
ncbi:MAG: hypothetical protein M1132_02345 [Chloroflexi bacterium]|nr:hypothetical protein [Chloroflexota bacterium]